jgi:metal-responsive CopG/Arc/MetJ family transcriptional regulator
VNQELRFGITLGYASAMKTSISIPDRIYRAAERAAKRQKVSRSRIYTQAVEAYLKALPKSRQPKE